VRFLEDIAGTHELGGIGWGEEMEISTYIEHGITSELSGNIIDLCPVGALTSKPYAFTARSWELTHHYSIDIMDSLGSHIRLDTKNDQIMRILPQAFDPINEEWLSDRARFSYDGLKYQRLVTPLKAKGSSFIRISYNEAIENLAHLIKQSENPLFLGGALTDCETYFAFKNLTEKLGKGICDQEEALQPFVDSSNYLCHSTIAGFEDFDSLLIIGSNPRWEAPLLNARIRKAFLQKNTKIALLNGDDKIDLHYPYQQLVGDPSQVLWDLWRGKHPYVKTLEESKKPAILIGARFAAEVLDLLEALAHKYGIIKDNWRGLNILHPTVGALNALESNFIASDRNYQADLTIALGADEVNLQGSLVYLGHHGDRQVYNSSLIIATPAHPEKSSSHVNLEGRAQRSAKAVNPLEEARPEYQIALDLADLLEVKLDFWNLESLHNLMTKKNKIFAQNHLFTIQSRDKIYQPKIPQKPHKVAYQPFYDSCYLTNAITRSSLVLQKCHELLEKC
jgi:NADH-quinone oxidoreductase subunit G